MRHTLLPTVIAILMLASCGTARYIRQGEKAMALGEYYDAAQYFRKAYQKTPARERTARGQIALRMGRAYSRSLQTARAIAAYRNAERYHQGTDSSRLDLAMLLMKDGSYNDAMRMFEAVPDTAPGGRMAAVGRDAARQAADIKARGSHYTVRRMEALLSRGDDYSPMFLPDDTTHLYFSSTRDDATGTERSAITGTMPADLFVSTQDDRGQWGRPEAVTGGVNTVAEEGACCFTPDGRTMYLTRCTTDANYPRYAQIVVSQRADAAWGPASPLTLSADTLSSFAHPAVSPDGQWLYFVSDMPGGQGGLDIWRVRLTAAGPGAMENLGPDINTPGDEMFPTFRPNGDLCFSSNGRGGLGGLDIFIARIGNDGRWHIDHPGYPLNSQGDDFGMTFAGPYNKGVFCSNRDDARGYDHLYTFCNPEPVQTVTGWVYEDGGYELPAAEVRIIGDDGTRETVSVRSDGSFRKVVTPGVRYLLMASCKGYLNHLEEVAVPPHPTQPADTTLQFALASIAAPVIIDHIYYDFDKATLRDSSRTALDRLVRTLNDNPHVTIELSAHCDYKGSEAYNQQLSQRRAETVVRYLTAHGIAADRLTAVGYGKTRPRTVSRRQAERYPWLKEGDTLTQTFITALHDTARQEICNQLNRRTEFTVRRTTYGLFDKAGKLKTPHRPRRPEAGEDRTEFYFEP